MYYCFVVHITRLKFQKLGLGTDGMIFACRISTVSYVVIPSLRRPTMRIHPHANAFNNTTLGEAL